MAGTPPQSGRARRLKRVSALALLVVGILLIAEASVTVLWQEPFTALSAHGEQKKLSARLDRIAVASTSDTDNLAALARRLERRSGEGDPLGRIVIPRIDTKFVWVSGTRAPDLRKGPGHYVDTALPGERGTVGIAGHRTTYLAPFRNIDDLDEGDRIELRMPYGTFTYEVAGTDIVSPRDVSVLRHRSGDWLVLTACHPLYSAAKRIVVSARLTRAAGRPPADSARSARGAARAAARS
jgi:sortase A